MEDAARALRPAILSFQQTMTRVKMARTAGEGAARTDVPAVVLPYKPAAATAGAEAPGRRLATRARWPRHDKPEVDCGSRSVGARMDSRVGDLLAVPEQA